MSTTASGRHFEDIAAKEARRLGWSILRRNYYGGGSEIDIIAFANGRLRFIEVRGSAGRGDYLEQSVGVRKRRLLIQAAQAYLEEHTEPEVEDCEFLLCFISAIEPTIM